ncbi:MAG: PAS domain S-box protein, partial [Methanomicrobiales archaeon]
MAEALRVLYIDDEPALLDLCKIYLEKTGKFSVDISISGKEALTQLGKQQYDAIISDYQMPGMDGIDLLKAVRDSHGNIPFILFTGRGREEVVIEAINNGVDFYLQKGGDPKAQFAELEHKIRQAIARRQAENSLNESEKRLADIINFLPDATFAIDRSGQVIAWNRAIEEMTGVTAADILGKGEYEYAIPFYGKRRPILIDLLFKPEEDISKHYKGISREKDVLIAETDLSQPKGVQRTLMGKASPLFNQKGEISGAIESIRDITRMKETEQSLQEQNQVLAAMNQFSLELASLPVGESIGTFIVRKLMELTGGVAAWYSDYHPADHTLIISHLESGHGLLEKAVKILGKDPHEIKTVVSADQYMEIVSSAVKKLPTLTDVSFGQIPPAMSFAIQKVLGIDHFFGLVYVIEGELFATSVLAIGKGKQAPSVGLLESFSHMVAVSLRRRSAEEKLRAGEDKFRTVADFTYGWEYWEAPDHSIIYMSPSCERISGYSREEFQQNPSLNDSIVDPRDMEVWENHRKEADETKTALSLDIRILRKDGELCWINHTCHPVFDSAGRHLGRRASNRDITEKKRVDDELRAAYEELNASQEELQAQFEALIQGEQQIRESEEKFRLLLQHVPSISVQGYNMDGTTQYWNDASESLYGYTAQEAVGKNLIDLVIPPEMKDEVRKAITYMAESGQPIPASELSLMRKDGTRVAVFSSHAIVKRARGGTELFCIDIDLTERKQAEEALSESEQKYREIFEKSVTGIFKTTHDGLL